MGAVPKVSLAYSDPARQLRILDNRTSPCTRTSKTITGPETLQGERESDRRLGHSVSNNDRDDEARG
ncbi:MAG: hypothetical protein H0Z37_08590 [Firmicutes bacterium]|nr:hypothetical protein [Bacillota bacterium]